MINENRATAEREPHMLPIRKADATGASAYDGRGFSKLNNTGSAMGLPSCSLRATETVVP